MPKQRIEMMLEIHYACTDPLYDVLLDISDEQFNWRPAPNSRSISEMMCHLIRVDNSYLKLLNQEIKTTDPKNGSVSDVLYRVKQVHQQIYELLKSRNDDSELYSRSTAQNASEKDTINEHILHSYQHNLYHLSQMIYLRRALDRKWISPIDKWDKATRIIADYLKP